MVDTLHKRRHGGGMDTKHRVGGTTISVTWTALFARELFVPRAPGKALEILWALVEPTWFFTVMVSLGLFGVAYFSWPVLGFVCPSIRLRSLAPLIETAMIALEGDNAFRNLGEESKVLMPSLRVPLREVEDALIDLGIPCPPFNSGAFLWGDYLSKLLHHARKGRLKRARAIWSEMKQEREKH